MGDDKIIKLDSYRNVIDLSDRDKAIDEIMKEYTKDVYLLAYSFVKDQGFAEDISQEVFIKCYNYMDSFRGDSSIKTWIYRITVNTAKDFLRKRNFNILKFPVMFFDRFSDNHSTEQKVFNSLEKEELLGTVLSLPTKYREVIILFYFYDLKVEEIAQALQISVNTVKTRLSRGREKLKGIIDLKGGDLHG